jgi:hypothetical protein
MRKLHMLLIGAALALAATGCQGLKSVVTTTQTGLGISISENPSTQLYEARLGYFRNEFAFVPGDTNCPATVPDVMMEIRMENIFKGGLVYQRLAVGKNAVQQPGASLMFARDKDGGLNSNVVDAISQKVRNIPEAPK